MAFTKELQKDFIRLIDNNKLSHGFLFFGEFKKEINEFALQIANYLENGFWSMSDNVLFDSLVLGEELLGIEAARSIRKFLWQKPIKSRKRTLIIKNAQKLTVHAQNAILKVVEEPPESALIILIVRDPEGLLAALSSRFQKFYFSSSKKNIEISDAAEKFAKQVIGASTQRQLAEILKLVLEDQSVLDDFIKALINYFNKDKIKNWRVLKSILERWTLINQFNTNKRLQLEAALFRVISQ